MRFLPRARARLIVAAESVGWAMKNRSSEIAEPGVGPLAQVVPNEFCCTAGTKPSYGPFESMRRNGFSRVSGLVVRVVYGGGLYGVVEKLCGGAPLTPANT